MIERFLDAGHRVGRVNGDEVYGGNPKLRAALEEREIGYVLAVACSAEVPTGAGIFRVDALARKGRSEPGRSCRSGLARRDSGSTTGPSLASPKRDLATTSS